MSKNNKKVVTSKTVLTAPNLKRFLAYVIDQVILYILFAIVLGMAGVNPENPATVTIFLVCVLIAIAYKTLVPLYVFRGERVGQTLGKRVLGLKTINADGTEVTMVNLLIRNAFSLLVEGFDFLAVTYLYQAIAILGFPLIVYASYANLFIGLLSVVLMVIKPSHRLLHDYISNTVVILMKQ